MVFPVVISAISSVDLTPIEGVQVSVWNETYTTVFDSGLTDASGEFATGLNAGAYKVFFLKEGHTFYPLPKGIGVEAAPVSVEYKGTPVETPPLPSGYTYLYGTIKDTSLNPSSLPVFVHLAGAPQTKDGAVLERSTTTVVPDETGYWGILLAGGAHVTVSIPGCMFQKTGVLPFNGNMNVTDLGLYG